MDGIGNIGGTRTATLQANGKKYTLVPQVLSEYAERERYILGLKPNPFDVLKSLPEGLPDAVRERFEERAWKDANRAKFVTMAEETEFDRSLHGIGWRLWRALRVHHPEIDSVQAALSLIEQIGSSRLTEVVSKLDQAEEKDILGKSAGPGPDGATVDLQQTDRTNVAGYPGPSFTAVSANATAGDGEMSMH